MFKFVSLLFHRHDLRNCFLPSLSPVVIWGNRITTGNLIVSCISYELYYSNQNLRPWTISLILFFFFLNTDATVLLRMSHSMYEVTRDKNQLDVGGSVFAGLGRRVSAACYMGNPRLSWRWAPANRLTDQIWHWLSNTHPTQISPLFFFFTRVGVRLWVSLSMSTRRGTWITPKCLAADCRVCLSTEHGERCQNISINGWKAWLSDVSSTLFSISF